MFWMDTEVVFDRVCEKEAARTRQTKNLVKKFVSARLAGDIPSQRAVGFQLIPLLKHLEVEDVRTLFSEIEAKLLK